MSPESILLKFGIENPQIATVGSGHIHHTYKVKSKDTYILQCINKDVFRDPEAISSNNRIAFKYLQEHHPSYLFPQTLPDLAGNDLVYDENGYPWRIYPFIENTVTIDQVSSEEEAFEAAAGFARLSRNLNAIDTALFKPTLDRFHDLSLRYEQFEFALDHAEERIKTEAAAAIRQAKSFQYLVDEYREVIASNGLKVRIVHNDTKINNILFNAVSRKSVCVIDLDTLMPGYFIYDLGDMVRTMVSPVSEEEKDLTKVIFRKNVYDALLKGYLSEMESVLTTSEKQFIPFAGKMMTYIMALRFLADFLRGNTYYHTTYATQNLVRATNQLHLLGLIEEILSRA